MESSAQSLTAPADVLALAVGDNKKAPHGNGSALVLPKTVDVVSVPKSDEQRPIMVAGPAQQSWINQARSYANALEGSGRSLPWAVKDLLLQGTANCISGQPHTMKSFNMLAGCMEVTARQTLWGHFAAPNIKSTLFIETEDPELLVEARIRGLGRGLGITDPTELSGFRYLCLGKFDVVQEGAKLMELARHYKPGLMVLSTLQGLLGSRNWKEQPDMAPVNRVFDDVARVLAPFRGSLVVVTHSPFDDKVGRPIGSVSQLANYTTAIHFRKRAYKDETVIEVSVDSKLGVSETTFNLEIEFGEGEPDESQRPSKEVRRVAVGRASGAELIKKAVQENPTLSGQQIAALLGGKVSARYVNRVKKEMGAGGKKTSAKKVGDGLDIEG